MKEKNGAYILPADGSIIMKLTVNKNEKKRAIHV